MWSPVHGRHLGSRIRPSGTFQAPGKIWPRDTWEGDLAENQLRALRTLRSPAANAPCVWWRLLDRSIRQSAFREILLLPPSLPLPGKEAKKKPLRQKIVQSHRTHAYFITAGCHVAAGDKRGEGEARLDRGGNLMPSGKGWDAEVTQVLPGTVAGCEPLGRSEMEQREAELLFSVDSVSSACCQAGGKLQERGSPRPEGCDAGTESHHRALSFLTQKPPYRIHSFQLWPSVLHQAHPRQPFHDRQGGRSGEARGRGDATG